MADEVHVHDLVAVKWVRLHAADKTPEFLLTNNNIKEPASKWAFLLGQLDVFCNNSQRPRLEVVAAVQNARDFPSQA